MDCFETIMESCDRGHSLLDLAMDLHELIARQILRIILQGLWILLQRHEA